MRTGGRFDTVSEQQAPFGFTASGINNLDQVAGSSALPGGGSLAQQCRPFARQFSEVTGWSSNGSGLYTDGPGETKQGFVDTDGNISTIAVPGGFATQPAAINNLGEVAGNYSVVTYPKNPPTFIVTQGFIEAGGAYTTIAVPGATDTEITGINDLGQVVGDYSTGRTTGAFVATPMAAPEDRDALKGRSLQHRR